MVNRLIRYWRIERPKKKLSPSAAQELRFALLEQRPISADARAHMHGLCDVEGNVRADVIADFEPLRQHLAGDSYMTTLEAYETIKQARDVLLRSPGNSPAHAFMIAQFDKWIETLRRDMRERGADTPFDPPSYVEMFIGPSWID